MAEANSLDEAAAEKKPDGPSPESVPLGTTFSRVKLLDTMVDTFLQKLVAAGSYQRFADCYEHLHQLQPETTQRIHDKFITQLQASIREEISEIKEEGNLETVLNSLDKIVEDGKNHKGPAWRPSGTPERDLCSVLAPYFLQQRDTLRRHVQKQEARNQELAEAVLAGRRQVEALQQRVQAQQQAWQALRKERRELAAVLMEPEGGAAKAEGCDRHAGP